MNHETKNNISNSFSPSLCLRASVVNRFFRLGPFTTLKKGNLRSGKFPERHELAAKGDS